MQKAGAYSKAKSKPAKQNRQLRTADFALGFFYQNAQPKSTLIRYMMPHPFIKSFVLYRQNTVIATESY